MQLIDRSKIKTSFVMSFGALVVVMLLPMVFALDLIVLPSPSSAAYAPAGYALHFARGSSQYASMGAISLVGDTAITLEAWVKADSFETTAPSISSIAGEENATGGALLRLANGDPGNAQFVLRVSSLPGGETVITGSKDLSTDTWYHVAVTTDTGINADNLDIGKAGSNYLQGKMDEVQIWSDARTAAEIRDNMFRTLKGNEGNLVAYYRFDQGTAGEINTDLDLDKLYNLVSSSSGTLTNFTLTGSTSNWVSSSAFNTWEGSDSGTWSTPGNWSRGAAPGATDNVGLFAWTGGNNVAVSGPPTVNHMGVATGAAPTLSSAITANGNLILDADLTLGGNADVNGTLIIAASTTLDASSGNNYSINVAGDWSNSGTFTPQNGTVTLDGSGQALSGATSFYKLTKNVTSADTLTFESGSANKTTITNTLDLQGQSGKLLSLRSSSADTQWEIDPQGTRTVGYLDVKDSNNVNATVINASDSVDSGNNTKWFFPAAPILDTTTPTSYDCSVTKVEMHNGTSWVTIFSGTAALDVVPGGTFLGISDLSLPAGTYSQIKVTFSNAFPLKGSRSYGGGGDTYYTTAAPFEGQTNLASTPTTVAGSIAEFTFRIEAWGAINTPVPQTFAITPVTVGPLTDYQPTVRVTISDKLELKGTDGTPSTYYFALSAPTVSIVEP